MRIPKKLAEQILGSEEHSAKVKRDVSAGKVIAQNVAVIVSAATGIPHEMEFRFSEKRKFRFDVAWPSVRVAFEFDGGITNYARGKSQGGHQRVGQYTADREKDHLAQMEGWHIVRACRPQVESDWAAQALIEAIERRHVTPKEG